MSRRLCGTECDTHIKRLSATHDNAKPGRFPRRREDQVLNKHRRAFDAAAAPVLEELRAAGVKAWRGEDLVDLAHEPLRSQQVGEILCRWLSRVEQPALKGTIAQALTDPKAGVEAARVALAELRRPSSGEREDRMTREQLAFCVAATATAEMFDEIADVVREPGHGEARELLLDMLPRLGHPGVQALALEVLDDQELRSVAIATLGRVGDGTVLPALEALLQDPDGGEYARLAIADIRGRGRSG